MNATNNAPQDAETTRAVEYTWVVDEWGDVSVSDEESDAACERAEEWLTEHEGNDVSISVRRVRRGECAGIYEGQQILGYSIPVPEEVKDLTNRAWEHACETWDRV